MTSKKIDRLRTLAQQHLNRAKGNWEHAARSLQRRIRREPDLYRTLMEPLVERAIWSLIQEVARSNRRTSTVRVMERRVNVNPDSTDGLDYRAASYMKSEYDYPLQGGLLLGDAMYDDLVKAVEYHRRNRIGNHVKEIWLTPIMNRMSEHRKKIVKSVVTLDEIKALREQAQSEVNENE